jgi:hypothetical protein
LAGKKENVNWGLALRTQASAGSEWIQLQNSVDRAIALELAFLRYSEALLGGEIAFTAGRQKPTPIFDSLGQVLIDSDVRFDGFGWAWKKDAWGLNLAQYMLGARSQGTAGASTFTRTEAHKASPEAQSGFAWLFSFQPTYKWKLNEEIEAQFVLGYHIWSGTGGNSNGGFYTNAIHGGQAGTAGNVNPVVLDNARQWQLHSSWTLPWKLKLSGEYVRNKKTVYGTRVMPTKKEADNSAYSVGLAWNKIKAAGDFAANYTFVHKGIGSVIGTFTDSDMAPDLAGHLVNASYGISEALSFTFRYMNFHELGKVGGDGLSLASPNEKRKQTQSRYDLVLNMSF